MPDCQIIIVGEGEMRVTLEKLIAQLGVTDNVQLIGFVEKSQIEQLLSTCDCLCLPSLERTEAFGLVLLEAMLFSKPVVASYLPGPSWIVDHQKTGLLVTPGSVNELVHAINAILRFPEVKKQMGQEGRYRAAIEHGRKDIAARKLLTGIGGTPNNLLVVVELACKQTHHRPRSICAHKHACLSRTDQGEVVERALVDNPSFY
ncbi:MAG: hypothetical protein OMM_12424 [Candidatus Magnetoglobus multicellularis str. Araruama]|uniref:Glycosyl transferase family 1 domain-containing protein n=1 Tax=Candidatus Magnetoglobus multicellularis str. Araruama TaxID=890399 RepID=A0A1V1NW57_9BACT|nr:MAG: hypothetical protein OMM_12424 [Candidatus Magnetoglobus multicellularis str. Araruama]